MLQRLASSCWAFAFSLVLKMRFPPSVVESKHGWHTAMHLQGRNGVESVIRSLEMTR